MKKKRQELRIPVEDPIAIKGQTGIRSGTTFNLSASGCAFESSQSIEPGATVQLELSIPDDKKPVKVSRAKVTWKWGSDTGVQFLDMNETAKVRLQRYIESVAAQTPKKKKS